MITKTANRTLLSMAGMTYDFQFRIDSADELEVYGIDSDGVATELTTGFSVDFDAETETGTVTFDSEPATYDQILMLRAKTYTQGADIPLRAGFSEEDIELALDHIVMLIQQIKEITDYCLKADLTSEAASFELPSPDAGKAIVWNVTEDGFENSAIDLEAIATAVADLTSAVSAAEAAQIAAEVAQAAAEAAAASIPAKASQAEAEAGVIDTKYMTPLSTAYALAALVPGLQVKVGTFTRDMTAVSGDVDYDVGISFTPKLIICFSIVDGTTATASWGMASAASVMAASEIQSSGARQVEAQLIGLYENSVGPVKQSAILKSFNANGFSLTWEKGGSPSAGTGKIMYALVG